MSGPASDGRGRLLRTNHPGDVRAVGRSKERNLRGVVDGTPEKLGPGWTPGPVGPRPRAPDLHGGPGTFDGETLRSRRVSSRPWEVPFVSWRFPRYLKAPPPSCFYPEGVHFREGKWRLVSHPPSPPGADLGSGSRPTPHPLTPPTNREINAPGLCHPGRVSDSSGLPRLRGWEQALQVGTPGTGATTDWGLAVPGFLRPRRTVPTQGVTRPLDAGHGGFV